MGAGRFLASELPSSNSFPHLGHFPIWSCRCQDTAVVVAATWEVWPHPFSHLGSHCSACQMRRISKYLQRQEELSASSKRGAVSAWALESDQMGFENCLCQFLSCVTLG